ncbi:TPA: GpE family phage tail protein, partial [Morganella morganii]
MADIATIFHWTPADTAEM